MCYLTNECVTWTDERCGDMMWRYDVAMWFIFRWCYVDVLNVWLFVIILNCQFTELRVLNCVCMLVILLLTICVDDFRVYVVLCMLLEWTMGDVNLFDCFFSFLFFVDVLWWLWTCWTVSLPMRFLRFFFSGFAFQCVAFCLSYGVLLVDGLSNVRIFGECWTALMFGRFWYFFFVFLDWSVTNVSADERMGWWTWFLFFFLSRWCFYVAILNVR